VENRLCYRSDRNENEIDSGEFYLLPLIKAKVLELIKRNIAVIAVTTDNASNMISMGKEMYKQPEFRPNCENSGPVILHMAVLLTQFSL